MFRDLWRNRFVVLKGERLYISDKEVRPGRFRSRSDGVVLSELLLLLLLFGSFRPPLNLLAPVSVLSVIRYRSADRENVDGQGRKVSLIWSRDCRFTSLGRKNQVM